MTTKRKSLPPPPKAKRMDDLGGVLDEMKAVYRDARHERVRAGDATKLVYMLREIRETMEVATIEARLKRIEERLG